MDADKNKDAVLVATSESNEQQEDTDITVVSVNWYILIREEHRPVRTIKVIFNRWPRSVGSKDHAHGVGKGCASRQVLGQLVWDLKCVKLNFLP